MLFPSIQMYFDYIYDMNNIYTCITKHYSGKGLIINIL